MVTCLTTIQNLNGTTKQILSGDRDEKVRVTAFPNSYVLNGLLLGHTGFVSAVASNKEYCATASGDSSVRLWNTSKSTSEAEIKCWNVDSIAAVVAISEDNVVAFASDGANEVHVVSEKESEVVKGEGSTIISQKYHRSFLTLFPPLPQSAPTRQF